MMKVRCYRNLHNGKISIKSCEHGLVLGYADSITLRSPKFIVHESGRQKVLSTKQKNVHAYVEGVAQSVTGFVKREQNVGLAGGFEIGLQINTEYHHVFRCTYNPYKHKTFVNSLTGHPVLSYTSCCIKSTGEILC